MKGLSVFIAIIVVLVIGGFYFTSKGSGPVNTPPGVNQIPTQPTSAVETPGTKTFTIEGKPFEYNPKEIKVKKGDRVKIVFKNMQGFHDLTIADINVKTQQIQAGQSDTIEFVADKAGAFEYYCSVDGHRAQGMVGKLIVE